MKQSRQKQRQRTKKRHPKTRSTKKRGTTRRGGSLSDKKIKMFVFGYPNHINPEETYTYVEVNSKNLKDMTNLELVDNMFRGMVYGKPPIAYRKTIDIEKN